jgi:hypothetical protein
VKNKPKLEAEFEVVGPDGYVQRAWIAGEGATLTLPLSFDVQVGGDSIHKNLDWKLRLVRVK